MTGMDDIFGDVSPLQALADEQVRADRGMLADLVGHRRSAGTSQEEVGKRLGVSQAAIQQFERAGGDPHLSTIRRYALALGVLVTHNVTDVSKRLDAADNRAVRRRSLAREATHEEWTRSLGRVVRGRRVGDSELANP